MTAERVVVVTGGRDFLYPDIVRMNLSSLYVQHGGFTLFHGACRDKRTGEMVGADRFADDWGQPIPDVEVKRFEADWALHGYRAGPIRNRQMVAEAVRRVPREMIHGLAFPTPRSRGTWGCVKEMSRFHIEPDVWDYPRIKDWLSSR